MSVAQVSGTTFGLGRTVKVDSLNKKPTFPRLPVTSCVSEKLQSFPGLTERLDKTLLVFVQHLLETTGSLLVELNKCGIQFSNMFGKGKSYSTCRLVSESIKKLGVYLVDDDINTPVEVGCYRKINEEMLGRLWSQVESHLAKHPYIESIIILDEGGRCVEKMPTDLEARYCVTAIEQTRGGLYSPAIQEAPFPVTLVATSAVKQKLESDLIANVVLRKLEILICNRRIPSDAVCGVVGNGAVGKAVVKYLINAGLRVFVYDINPHSFSEINSAKFNRVDSLEQLLISSEVIFGCTGKDVFSQELNILDSIEDNKFFVSCSSEDREFYSLIQLSKTKQKWLDDVVVTMANTKKITILNGGFPINFDYHPESVPRNSIDLTRALLLASFAQAISHQKKNKEKHSSFLMLSPVMQKYIAEKWLFSQGFSSMYPKKLIRDISSLAWIKEKSGGGYHNMEIESIFS